MKVKPLLVCAVLAALSGCAVFIMQATCAIAVEPPRDPILRIEAGMHVGKISGIDIDRDNRYVATVSQDKTIRIWEFPSGKLLKVIRPPIGPGNEGMLYTVAFSPDGKNIACGGWTDFAEGSLKESGDGHNIYIFDRESGQCIKRIAGLPAVVHHLRYSPDGRFLAATLGLASGLRVFRTDTYASVAIDKDYGAPTYEAMFDHRGKLFTSSFDGFIRLYDASFRLVAKSKAPGGEEPRAIACSPDGETIVVGFMDSTKVNVMSGRDLTYLFSLDTTGVNNDDRLSIVAYSHDGKSIYAGGSLRKRGLYQKTSVLIRRWSEGGKGHFIDIRSAEDTISAIIPLNGGGILYGAMDPAFGVIDTNDKRTFFKGPVIPDYRASSLYTSPDGSTVLFSYEGWGEGQARFSIPERHLMEYKYGTKPRKVEVLKLSIEKAPGLNVTDWRHGSFTPKLNGQPLKLNPHESSRSMAISPDGKSFALGTDWHLRLYNREGNEKWLVPIPAVAWQVTIPGNGNLILVALGDGTIRWHRIEDGRELLAFFPVNDKKKWVMWTPEGYFDSSPDAADLVGYHVNQGKDRSALFVTLNNLYDVFYRPDIVQTKFAGEDIHSLVTLTAQEALMNPPPTVSFSAIPSETSAATINVCYSVNSSGGGIGEVRLFHNGKLLRSDGFYRETVKALEDKGHLMARNSRAIYQDMRAITFIEKEEPSFITNVTKGDVFKECTEIATVSGENEVGITAFNKGNTVQSSMETKVFQSSAKSPEPHLYILVIGINQYKDSAVNLKYAVKDAVNLKEKMRKQSATVYASQNIHYSELLDSQATKGSILKKIDDLSKVMKPSDSFVLFVASHGVLIRNQYYIVTHDYGGTLSGEVLIGSNDIVNMSKILKSLNQLYIFDTCHAGGMDSIISGLYDARMSTMAKKMGLHIFASASTFQEAVDGYKGNGLFTHTLLDGFSNKRNADTNKDRVISISELGSYAKSSTMEISKTLNHPQVPLIINFGRDAQLYKLK